MSQAGWRVAAISAKKRIFSTWTGRNTVYFTEIHHQIKTKKRLRLGDDRLNRF
jgi:hypothetical protein